MRVPRRLGAIAVVLLVAAACGEPETSSVGSDATASPVATATFEPTPTTVAGATPTEDPFADGFVLTMNASYDPTFRPEQLVQGYDLFVIGRVVEELPARWTTPDGLRPADLMGDVPDRYTIITPYVLDLGVPEYIRDLTGPLIPLNDRGASAYPADTTRLILAAEGGTVGKDSVVHSPSYLFTVGERALIGLVETRTDRTNSALEPLFPMVDGPVWWAASRFILGDDGSAAFYDQSLPATEIVSGLLDALARKNAGTPAP